RQSLEVDALQHAREPQRLVVVAELLLDAAQLDQRLRQLNARAEPQTRAKRQNKILPRAAPIAARNQASGLAVQPPRAHAVIAKFFRGLDAIAEAPERGFELLQMLEHVGQAKQSRDARMRIAHAPLVIKALQIILARERKVALAQRQITQLHMGLHQAQC